MGEGHDVFLSYDRRDQAEVVRLAEALRRRGVRPWLDVWDLAPGRPWQEELEAVIRTVPAAAVIVGRRGLGPWEARETRAFLEEYVRRRLPVVPVLLPGALSAGLPVFLRAFGSVDLRAGITAAGVDRLVWGITGEKHARHTGTEENDPELIYVPGGDFVLGGEGNPRHRVVLSPFRIGKYPVTNEQYGRFLAATGHRRPSYWDADRFAGSAQPVVGVDWRDAKAYCAWAGLKLPSEAQWEAAARGTDGRRYPWGNDEPTPDRADYGKIYRSGQPDPVGSHPGGSGPYGAEDQAGCVWEWCEDVWNERAQVDRDGLRDPVSTTGDAADRVVRGGSWAHRSRFLPAAIRCRFWSALRERDVGFRVVEATRE